MLENKISLKQSIFVDVEKIVEYMPTCNYQSVYDYCKDGYVESITKNTDNARYYVLHTKFTTVVF